MSQAASPSEMAPGDTKSSIYLVSYPKIVFLYPTYLMAILAGVYMLLFKEPQATGAYVVSGIFLAVFGLNLIVFAFDFPRGSSLTLVIAIVAVVLGLFLVVGTTELIPFVRDLLSHFRPAANATFYLTFVAVMSFIYVAVFIRVRFDYWEVNANELLHHHGFLSDLERFSSTGMKVDKEITDVFEYILLRSGRLILHPTNERRAIVLDNIFFINRKEAELTKLLGALRVKVESEPA